jgi:two-component system cell cycle response regulator DivK
MGVQPKDATILVVEDNFQNFVLITRLLAYLGVKRCEWKASGWQVLEFAESLPHIDLILMDIFLPEEDGYQVLERLRAYPRFKDTLIVAVTADASLENMERARSAGFDGFIGKPLDPDRFPAQIRSILREEEIWEPG